jgi:glycosyltransferase involved in cell wall biosynthesis
VLIVYLSVVIPVYNEEESLPRLRSALEGALGDFEKPWEVVFVDDGSKDGSAEVLARFAQEDPRHLRAVLLRRNFGQTTAIAAGIDHASGEMIVLMDADLQNDPADIPRMLEKLDEGYDVVSGWRKDRKDAFLTRTLPSRMANGLISWVTGVKLHDYGCTLKAYRREVITGFRLYGEMHRFIPVYAHSVGARIVEMPVQHHPRRWGKAKYGLERITKVILDLFTVKFLSAYTGKPSYLFGGIGGFFMIISAILLVFLAVRRLTIGTEVLPSPFFQVAIVMLSFGFQAVLMGLIAELLARTYHESQHKPTYTVRKRIGVDEPNPQGKANHAAPDG